MDSFLEWFQHFKPFGISLLALTKFTSFVIAGLILARIFRYPIARWLEKITPESDHDTSLRISRSIEWSAFILVFMLVLKSGAIDVLYLPGWAWEKSQQAVTVIIAIAATTLFLQIVELALYGLRQRWQQSKSQIDDSLIKFLRKGIRVFVVIIAALVTMDNIGFKVTGAIAGLGIGGAAIALGAQNVIANLIGTVEIVADKLFRVGDRIHFEQFDGFVTDVGLRSTRIRALSGEQILVPNRKMAEVQIRNFSRNGLVRTTVNISLPYSTSQDQLRRAMQILENIFEERKDVESHQVYMKNLGAYSLDLEAILWGRYSTSAEYNVLIGEIHLEIKRRFDEAKIGFVSPTYPLQFVQTLPAEGCSDVSRESTSRK